MVGKLIKLGAATVGTGTVLGVLAFGGDLGSYLRSSAHSVRLAVKDKIPVEFELRRAHDLLDQIDPELHEGIRAVSEQEVAVITLRREIEEASGAVSDERERVVRLRDAVAGGQSSATPGSSNSPNEQLKHDLARRFAHLREAEAALTTKRALLEARERSLAAAQEALESAKAQKATLAEQIEGLEAQYQLVQAASVTSPSPASFDTSKLAQAKNAIAEIRNDLLVAEHVMAYEAKFTEAPATAAAATNETELLAQVDAHLQHSAAASPDAAGSEAHSSDAGK